ncbi:FAD-dependent oxidoreductase [Nonomuraea sp. NBC_01738]|uniref:FAD-dependent oxidoreductase n=1 Tax=Nonomuraea sp. NBC_01738 TaxID=2976003 RepID=UPI002E1232C5|nr:FAD-dependent oxidoreductase [Nonomuraea sp. NBC_01738]
MVATVVVVGGGYGGIAVAKELDDIADVVLVEARETFVHNVAALRGAVSPEWIERMFIPYDGLLANGRVVRGRAVRVSAGAVELESGEKLSADYLVLATGSGQPYPAKIEVEGRADASARLRATGGEIERAGRVLLLGAGPVGLEFAGEIKARWPEKSVVIVDPSPDLLSGRFPAEFRAELRAQLDALGVELHLGTALTAPPPAGGGPVTVTTDAGVTITADLWFACHGRTPRTGYLDDDLGTARRPDLHLSVTPELRLPGQDTVFAIGDINDVPEMKVARLAEAQAEVAAANIRALIEGRPAGLRAYEPGADAILLPLGTTAGVSYHPEAGVLGPEATQGMKGEFFLDRYLEKLGVKAAETSTA